MTKRRSAADAYRKTGGNGNPARAPEDTSSGFVKLTENESGRVSGDKAARLLLLLGTDEAAGVLARMHPREAEELAGRAARIRGVDASEAAALLQEFGDRFGTMELERAGGGVQAARSILTAAFGEEHAGRIIARSVPESRPKPFAFLNDLSFTRLSALLGGENARTLALVMAYLDPGQAAALLESLPPRERRRTVLRMARSESVSTEVLRAAEQALQEKLRLSAPDDEGEAVDGRSALADILRHMDIDDEKRLLGELSQADPDLADAVKEKLYTMDTVLHLRKRDLESILRSMAESEIAFLLKGQPPEIEQCITAALSSRRRLLVSDEARLLGAVPRGDAEAAAARFLERIREGEEKGVFVILRETDLRDDDLLI